MLSADGSGTLTQPIANVASGATGQSITFTYTAATGGINNGEVDIVIPTGWTAPTTSNAAGCVSSASGSVAISTRTIQWSGLTIAGGGTATITYGATSGGSCAGGDTATASSSNPGTNTFTTTEKSSAGGALTAIGVSPTVNIYSADGAGTGTVSPTSTLAGTANNTETATYTVSTGGVAANGVVELTIPANWTAPQKTTNNAAGYTTAAYNDGSNHAIAAGNIAISGSGPWTVDVTLPAGLASADTVTIVYGDTSISSAGAATAPSAGNAGNSVFTVKEKSTSGGALTTVSVGGGSQTVAVDNSADGAGTGTISPTSTLAGTTNNTETATYTATTGGAAVNGVVELTIPANWTAPQKTTNNAAGYTTAAYNDGSNHAIAAGNIAISGSGPWTVDVTLPAALDSGNTLTIVYGDTSISSAGAATAPSAGNAGNSVFTVKEKSTSGGALTTVSVGGGSQTVAVDNSADGAGGASVAPTSTLAGTTDNTETLTYTATTGGAAANGVVELSVPSGWTAPQKTTSTAAGYVTASYNDGSNHAIAAGNIAISGSGPWTVDVTLPAALDSGNTLTIVYGDTASGVNPGAAATAPGPSSAGNYSFGFKEKSTAAGTLTNVGTGSQTVAVDNSADGSGTLARTSALNIERGSAGNTVTFTYTAAAGGLNNGSFTIAVPTGWSAPSTSSSAKGYTTSDAGSVGVAGQLITISGLTLGNGATVNVVYGSTAGTGTGADAVSTYNVGDQTWQAQEKSTSGGTLTSLASSPLTHEQDTTAPTVTGVTASNANGPYGAGQTIHVQVSFSEPVNVTGSPKLALNTTPAESATYASGGGTSTLTFDYTVQAGDNVGTLDYTATNALTLNGGTIADPEANNATLTLASPGGAGSLSANKSLTIDTTAPTVSNVTASNSNGAYNAGQTIHVQVSFSEPVNVTGSPQLALNTSAGRVGHLCLRLGHLHPHLRLHRPGRRQRRHPRLHRHQRPHPQRRHHRRPGRQQRHPHPRHPGRRRLALGQQEPRPSTRPPRPSARSRPPTRNGAYNAGQTIHVQVNFSEPVNVTGSPQLALNTSPAESATYASGGGTSTLTFDYTVQAGDNAAHARLHRHQRPDPQRRHHHRPGRQQRHPHPRQPRVPPTASAPTRTSSSTPPPRPSAR